MGLRRTSLGTATADRIRPLSSPAAGRLSVAESCDRRARRRGASSAAPSSERRVAEGVWVGSDPHPPMSKRGGGDPIVIHIDATGRLASGGQVDESSPGSVAYVACIDGRVNAAPPEVWPTPKVFPESVRSCPDSLLRAPSRISADRSDRC